MANLSALTFVQGEAEAKAYSQGQSVLVLEFWATWCPPCRETIPHLSHLHTKYKDKNVVFVGVTNEPSEAQIKTFVAKMGANMTYPVALDPHGVVSSEWMGKYRVQGIPHAFVIARDGRLTWHGHPADPQFEHEIAAAAAASPAPNPSRTYTREELSGMSVKELKALLSARGVDASDCIEKSDLISRALQAS